MRNELIKHKRDKGAAKLFFQLSFLKAIFTLLLCSSLVLLSSFLSFALPEVGEIVSGSVVVSNPNPQTLQINASDKAIINYNSFNIAQNESVIVNLPNASNEILNRVTGNMMSNLMGSLICNGTFILTNPSGINIGATANIDAAGFIASTRDITNEDFLQSQHIFEKVFGKEDTQLVNKGTINIRKGGFGILIAGAVKNEGVISANVGTVALAAGDKVSVDISGDGLVSVNIDQETAETIYDINGNPITTQIVNTGTLEANGGQVILNARSATDVFRAAINLEGIVQAMDVEEKDGKIILRASGDIIVNTPLESGSVEIQSDKNINVKKDIIATSGDVDIYADHDGDGTGELTQSPGTVIQATGTGNVYLDGSGIMTLAAVKAEGGDIKVGTRQAPAFIDAQTPLEANTLTLIGTSFDVNSLALTTDLSKLGDLQIQSSTLEGNLARLQGDGVNITYLTTTNLTLRSNNVIDTSPGVIIQANQVRLIGRQFGTLAVPLNIHASQITLQRTLGSIDILESIGMGEIIAMRAPPNGFGSIMYNRDATLVLEAESTTILGTTPTYLYGNITFTNFTLNTPDKEIYFEAGKTYTFKGALTITSIPDDANGEYFIKFRSQTPGSQYFLNIETSEPTLNFINITDANAINSIFIPIGVNGGNNTNILADPLWDGGGVDNNWSTPANWAGDAVPTGADPVTFDTTSPGGSNKNCTVDSVRGDWTGNVTISNYATTDAYATTGVFTVALSSGTFTVTGSFSLSALNSKVNVNSPMTVTGNISVTADGSGFTNNSTLNVLGNFAIGGITTITNNGTATIAGDITGGVTCVWTNAASSTLNIAGALLSMGTLNASADGNLVNYNGSGAQAVKYAASSYHDIEINSTDTVTQSAAILLDGNFTMTSGVYVQNHHLIIIGSYSQANGTFTSDATKTFSAGSFALNGGTFSRFAGGNGDPGTPFQITDVYGLQAMKSQLTKSFILNNDIDASGTSAWNSGAGFDPVGADVAGDDTDNFTGSFDGDGYIISGLYINRLTTNDVGLFGYVKIGAATIQDVGLTSVNITGSYDVGGFVGELNTGTVSGSYTTGTVTGTGTDGVSLTVGGLVGGNGGTITTSYSTATIAASGSSLDYNIGGLVGGNNPGAFISNCYATGSITVTGLGSQYNNIGGLVGGNGGTVANCYATGAVSVSTSSTNIGGLIGCNWGVGSATTSYAMGSVTASNGSFVGGFIGANWDSSTVANCYATGAVSGGSSVGGFVGAAGGTSSVSNSYSTGQASNVSGDVGGFVGSSWGGSLSACYYDTTTSGRSDTNGGSNPTTTTNMYKQATFAGWDFTIVPVWYIAEDTTYPLLTWTISVWDNDAGLGDPDWSTDANWVGDVAPSSGATVFFDGAISSADSSVDADFGGAITNIVILSSYGGTIAQARSLTVSGDFTQAGGTFDMNTNTLSVGGNFNIIGAITFINNGIATVAGNVTGTEAASTWTQAAGSTLNIAGDLLSTGTLNANAAGNLVNYNGSAAQTVKTPASSYHDITINSTNTVTQDDPLTMDGDFTMTAGTYLQNDHLAVTGSFSQAAGTFTSNTSATFSATSFALNGGTFSRFAGGNGDPGTPYQITDVYGLQAMKCYLTKSFILNGNIDASGTSNWDTNGDATKEGFIPVGTSASKFSGNFDGDNHMISDLYINRSSTSYLGLFGYTSAGEIKDLNMTGVNIAIGYSHIGSLVGYSISTITNCSAAGSVTGAGDSYNVGGLVGRNAATIADSYFSGNVSGGSNGVVGGFVGYNGSVIERSYSAGTVTGGGTFGTGGFAGFNQGASASITDCYSTASVAAAGIQYTGGFVGYAEETITNCYATGNVAGGQYTGGFVGGLWSAVISGCFSTGTVSGGLSVGGFVGHCYESTVTDCYSWSAVTGSSSVGGFAGALTNDSIINSYSAGLVTSGGANVGGFLGLKNSGTITSCYYDSTTSGKSDVGKGVPKTTVLMKTQATFSGWDFTSIWTIAETVTYPLLQWNAFTWDNGSGVDSNWSTAGNWVGDIMPGAGSTVTFNNTSMADSYVDAGFGGTVAAVNVYGSYNTGTITQQRSLIVSGNFDQDGGTYDLNGNTLNIGGDLAISGGTFINDSTLTFDGTGTSTVTDSRGTLGDLGAVVVDGTSKTINLASNIKVTSLSIGADDTLGLSTYTLYVTGSGVGGAMPFQNSGTFNENTGTVEYQSLADTDILGETYYNLIINGTGPFNQNAGSVVSVTNDFIMAAGTYNQNENLVITNDFSMAAGTFNSDATTPKAFSCKSFALNGGTFSRFAGGDGSVGAPYQIIDVYGLQAMKCYLFSYIYFILNDSIDATGTEHWDTNDDGVAEGFIPVGENPSFFYADFNGNHKTIDGLFINRPGENYVGLFGDAQGWLNGMYDLTMTNVDITGANYTGALSGLSANYTISNVNVISGEVNGVNWVGGLIGANFSEVSDSHTNVTVIGTGDNIGGFTGSNQRFALTDCYAEGDVTGDDQVGGLIGLEDDENASTITGCYATGTVIGSGDNIGGLVGAVWNYATPFIDCYATGDVTGSGFAVGGLIGNVEPSSAFTNCYATGNVEGPENVGGLVGNASDFTITDCYATGTVTGTGGTVDNSVNVGGLVGNAGGSSAFTNCYATGAVTANSLALDYDVGGLVGNSWGTPTFSKCYATGAVTAIGSAVRYNNVGGFIGSTNATITDCYATGAVAGSFAGGFVAWNGGSISNSYSIGAVTGASVGGFAAGNGGTITSCYYDTQTSGQTDTGKGEPKTTAEMKQQATFSGWDFGDTWYIFEGDDYPKLDWTAFVWNNGAGLGDPSWSTGANWVGGAAPTATDTVIFNNTSDNPSTADMGTIANIFISSTHNGTTTQGTPLSVTGSYSQAGGTFVTADNDLTVYGDLSVAGGLLDASDALAFLAIGGDLTVSSTGKLYSPTTSDYTQFAVIGDVTLSDSAIFTNNGILQFFTSPSSVLTDNRVVPSNIGAVLLTTSSTVTLGSDIKASAFAVANTCVLNLDTYTLTLTNAGQGASQPFQVLAGGTFNADTGTIKLMGVGDTDIEDTTYYNLILSQAGTTFYSTGNTTVSNIFTIDAGTFDAQDDTWHLTGSGTPFDITDPTGAFTASTSTISYEGAGATNILDEAYYNITFDGTGPFNLAGETTVSNVLTVASGTFDGQSYTLHLTGSGTPFVATGTFTPSTSTVSYEGTGATNVIDVDYYNLQFSPTSGTPTYTLPNSTVHLEIGSNFTITGNGTATVTAATNDTRVNVAGDFSIDADGVFVKAPNSEFTFDGTGTSAWSDSNTSKSDIGIVVLNGTTNTVSLGSDVKATMLVIYAAGDTLDLGSHTLTLTGSGQGASMPFQNNGTFNEGTGTVEFIGTSATDILNETYYDLILNGATTFSSYGDTTVSNVLTVESGATFDAQDDTWRLLGSGTPFVNNGTFWESTSTVSYEYTGALTTNVTAEHYYNLQFNPASGTPVYTFPAAQVYVNNDLAITGNGQATVTAATNNGRISINGDFSVDADGVFTHGSEYFVLTGEGTATWTDNNPTKSDMGIVVINNDSVPATSKTVNLGSDVKAGQVIIYAATATLGLQSHTLTLVDSGTPFSNVGGGTFAEGTGTVKYTGSASTSILNETYYNLTLDGTGPFNSTGETTVSNILNIASGTFDAKDDTWHLLGSGTPLVVTGTFEPSTSTVSYEGAGATGITAVDYYDLTLDGTGVFTPAGSLNIENNFTLTSGTLNAAANTLTVGKDFTNAGTFNAGTSTVELINSGLLSTVYGTTTFNNFKSTAAGKSIGFENGTTQTVLGILTLTGAAGNLVTLRSTLTGAQWKIDPQGVRSVSYVDVKDSNNINTLIIDPANSLNSGNNINWFSNPIPPEPAIDHGTIDNNPVLPGPGFFVSPAWAGDVNSWINIDYDSFDLTGSGFNSFAWEEGDTAYGKGLYKAGRYRTIAALIEGKIVFGVYDEKGLQEENATVIMPGETQIMEGEVGGNMTMIGFNFVVASQEGAEKMGTKIYLPGRYKTIVSAIEGTYEITAYDEAKVYTDHTATIKTGQSVIQGREIK